MLLSIVDATDRLKEEATNRLLFGELRHRIKNLFATVRALARQGTTEGRTAEEFRDDFLSRFGNLVRSFDVAFDAGPSAGLRPLVETTMAPFGGSANITLTGADDIDPGPTVLLSLSLVLHELGTNATKYGSLSVPGGAVDVSWGFDGVRNGLRLRWVGRDGPSVCPPRQTGYGTKLMTALITYNLGGEMEQTFGTQSFIADIFIPLADQRAERSEAPDHEERPLEEYSDR